MRTRSVLLGFALVGLFGCAEPPPNAACYIQPTTYKAGAAPPAKMFVANNQQWCSYASVKQFGAGEGYFDWARLNTPPSHGEVQLRMRPEQKGPAAYYRPKPGFTGEDYFDVEFGPGGNVRTILVTVRAPG